MPLPVITNDVRMKIRELVATSSRLYSRSKSDIRKEVASYNLGTLDRNGASGKAQQVNVDAEIPFWGV